MAAVIARPIIVARPQGAVGGGAMAPVTRRSIARRVVGAAGRAAMAEKHTAAAVVAAAALGLLERNNVPLPALGFVGTAGTYGIGAWLVGRYTGNQTMQHVATGLLSVAAYKLGKGETSGVSGDETIVGEF